MTLGRNLTAEAPGQRLDHPLPGDGTDPEAMLRVLARLAPIVPHHFVWYTSPIVPRR